MRHKTLALIWVRKNLVLGILLLFMLLGFQCVTFQKNKFTAQSEFILQNSDFSIFVKSLDKVDLNRVFQNIINDHKILKNPEFNGTIAADETLVARLTRNLRISIKPQSDQGLHQLVLNHLAHSLHRKYDRKRKAVIISFTSRSPGLSRVVVQNIIDTYVKALGNYKFLTRDQMQGSFMKTGSEENVIILSPQKPTAADPRPFLQIMSIFSMLGFISGIGVALKIRTNNYA